MASQLMSVCMAIETEYGARYIGAVQRLDNLKDKNGPLARELRGLISLYVAITCDAINMMPEPERDARARSYGGNIDVNVRRRWQQQEADAVVSAHPILERTPENA